MINDQVIIDNTHFELDESQRLICFTLLPDGTRYAQAVSSKEAVQKNMIGWCNTVREFIKVQEDSREHEKVEAKLRRKAQEPDPNSDVGEVAEKPVIPNPTTVGEDDPKVGVLAWYEAVQERIDYLSKEIDSMKDERKSLRDERDRIKPVIDAWKGVRGE
jgi:hypothetical protein